MTITYYNYIVRLSYYTTHPPKKTTAVGFSRSRDLEQAADFGVDSFGVCAALRAAALHGGRETHRQRLGGTGGRSVGEGWYGGSWRKMMMMTTCCWNYTD